MSMTRSVELVVVPDATQARDRIASSINTLLDCLGVKQIELAARIGMAQPMLNKGLHAKREFRASEVERIALALGVPVTHLYLGGDEIRRRARDGIFGVAPVTPDSGPGLGNRPSTWEGNVVQLHPDFIPMPLARTG